ncbi:hypothetical protein BC826DRAFT_966981 [Russula brevipes]|nr:hypothetical protein BC826DRAFT_966981 [Russula brevipes]
MHRNLRCDKRGLIAGHSSEGRIGDNGDGSDEDKDDGEVTSECVHLEPIDFGISCGYSQCTQSRDTQWRCLYLAQPGVAIDGHYRDGLMWTSSKDWTMVISNLSTKRRNAYMVVLVGGWFNVGEALDNYRRLFGARFTAIIPLQKCHLGNTAPLGRSRARPRATAGVRGGGKGTGERLEAAAVVLGFLLVLATCAAALMIMTCAGCFTDRTQPHNRGLLLLMPGGDHLSWPDWAPFAGTPSLQAHKPVGITTRVPELGGLGILAKIVRSRPLQVQAERAQSIKLRPGQMIIEEEVNLRETPKSIPQIAGSSHGTDPALRCSPALETGISPRDISRVDAHFFGPRVDSEFDPDFRLPSSATVKPRNDSAWFLYAYTSNHLGLRRTNLSDTKVAYERSKAAS